MQTTEYDKVRPKYPAGQLQPLVESAELPERQGLMTEARGSLQDLHAEHAVAPVSSNHQDEQYKKSHGFNSSIF
jgi:hypothetical protein